MYRIRDKICCVLLLTALSVFLFVGGRLISLYLEYLHGAQTYEELKKFAKEPEIDDATNEDNVESESPFLQIDFEGLMAQNPDVVAWIQIPALDISYPVVQGKDNDYYLHHMFNRESNKNGSIFIDYHNKPDFTDSNTIIYGHNMRDGSMFGTIGKYLDKKLYDQYPCFYIYVPGYVMEYQIISCYAGKTRSEAYTYRFPTTDDFKEFISLIRSYAEYSTKTEVDLDDKIVTLSTCVNTRRFYRYLIHGKLVKRIRNGE